MVTLASCGTVSTMTYAAIVVVRRDHTDWTSTLHPCRVILVNSTLFGEARDVTMTETEIATMTATGTESETEVGALATNV